MSTGAKILVGVMILAAIAFADASPAHADDVGWKEGKWRIELSGFTAYRSGKRSRTGDFGFIGSAEYEIPITKRLSIGIKTYPLFFYDQDDSGEDTVFGAGIGPEFRIYAKDTPRRGFFFEFGTAVLATVGRFDGNSGAVNFSSEAGLGYKFKRNWHVAAKIAHISNAGLATHNAGVNRLGLAFGYTF